jgi:hypothetical protein
MSIWIFVSVSILLGFGWATLLRRAITAILISGVTAAVAFHFVGVVHDGYLPKFLPVSMVFALVYGWVLGAFGVTCQRLVRWWRTTRR